MLFAVLLICHQGLCITLSCLFFIKILLKTLLFGEAEVEHGSMNDHYVCLCVMGNLLPTHMSHLAH